MKIINIQTEYLSNPLGIDIVHPRVTWNLENINKQMSYQIIYRINNGIKIKTNIINSSSMHYDFDITFNSKDYVEYQIVVNTDDNNTIISDLNHFEFGLLNKQDWKAKWIAGDYRTLKNKRYPVDYFQKKFIVNDVKKARMYISACGIYEAYINDKRVGNFILAPGSTDYRKRVQYQTYDITPLIKQKENKLNILLADGWYRGSIGAKGYTCVFGKETSFICQIEVEDSKGNITYILSDNTFDFSNDGPIRFADLKDGEIVDFNMQPSFNKKAKIIKKNVNLKASNNNFIEEREIFSPINSYDLKENIKVYEFKQNLAGYLSFEIVAKQNDIIKIKMGELIEANKHVTLKNIQCIRKGKKTPLQEIIIKCKEGINYYHSKFFIAGFKYIEVEGMAKINNIKQIALYSKIEEASSFECSNNLINIFYRNSLWSLKSNSADVPTDCPTRERMGWTGDSQVFFNTASFLTNYASFARKHIADIFDRQDKNGRLPQIAPYNAEDWFMDVMNGSVGWADAGILIPYRFYLKYGDERILENNFDNMIRYANFMIKRCGHAKGLYAIYTKPLHLSKENRKYGINTGQSYGEWAEPTDVKAFSWKDFACPHPEESMAYTSYVLGIMVKICKILHREEFTDKLNEYSVGIKKAYQELVSKEKYTLDTNRQSKLVRPLYMHLLNSSQEEFAKKRLITAIENYDYRLGTGFLSTPFILDVLSSYNLEMAYKVLENEKMPGWLYMAKNDTGTIWESWEGVNAQQGIASLNHYSKGALVEWLFKGMCGINIEKENSFIIEPLVGGHITYAKASYDSIYGTISSSWEKENDKIKFIIKVPGNTKAKFIYNNIIKYFDSGYYEFEI